jgi:hypothetical protein
MALDLEERGDLVETVFHRNTRQLGRRHRTAEPRAPSSTLVRRR